MDKKKILVMDDDRDILDAIKMVLQFNGFEVDTCMDDAFISKLPIGIPNLFLLDIWMSGISGSEICKRLKQNEATKHIPVILFSANRNIKEISEECEADGYIAKPFNLNQLLSVINGQLKS